ncbi:hypothetical protein [Streptomyces caatingaensis]|uniref:DUF4386 domain-containing protein n=1 Tax=Streptomyces caatingaensis TaxID=1678637 RepID=A0A0K9XKS4_9ACTN|nr:hypothetical protein [Streptomyces caatingaensis]KNB53252.1 hypothetical protein AC230_07365 [Streptomyces caatingaensis]
MTPPSLTPDQARQIRHSGWAGVLALPLMLLALFFVADHFPGIYPTWGDRGAEISAWFAAHRTGVILQVFAAGTGLMLLIWLITGLTAYLEAYGRRTIALRVMTPAAVATSVSMQLSNPPWLVDAFAGTTGHPSTDALVHYTYENSWMIYLFAQLYAAFLLVASATAFLQTRAFPAWAAWWTFAIAALCALGTLVILAGAGQLAPGALATMVPWSLFSLWMVAVGTALLRIGRP